jgi:hypothetical protein
LVGTLILAISGRAPFWGVGPTWQIAFFYLLAFGGTALGWLRGFLVAQVYTPYPVPLAGPAALGCPSTG